NETYRRMEDEARALLLDAGTPEAHVRLERQADLRYFGKTSYLTVPVPNGDLDETHVQQMIDLYNSEHEREYGYVASEMGEIEIANLRLMAYGEASGVAPHRAPRGGKAEDALKGLRRVYFGDGGGFVQTRIYDRVRLGEGAFVSGPAIIEQPDTTTVLPPGASGLVDEFQNLILTVNAR
ncbi:MAG: hydantoinase/oxoprolinase family protein, partial [Nitrospinota bacterium]